MTSRFRARYDKWLWSVLLSVVVLPLVQAGFFLATGESQGVLAMLVVTGIMLLVLWVVLPRRYELWPDHIRIDLVADFPGKLAEAVEWLREVLAAGRVPNVFLLALFPTHQMGHALRSALVKGR